MATTYKVSDTAPDTLIVSWHGKQTTHMVCRDGYHLTSHRLGHAAAMVAMRADDLALADRIQDTYPTAAKLIRKGSKEVRIGWSVEHAVHYLLGSLKTQVSKQSRADGAREWLRARSI